MLKIYFCYKVFLNNFFTRYAQKLSRKYSLTISKKEIFLNVLCFLKYLYLKSSKNVFTITFSRNFVLKLFFQEFLKFCRKFCSYPISFSKSIYKMACNLVVIGVPVAPQVLGSTPHESKYSRI